MTKAEREKAITKEMAVLNISREEAEELVAEDERIDKMTMGELKVEMGEEHWAVVKEMTKTGERKTAKTGKNAQKKPTNYKFDTKKHKKDDEKEDFLVKLAEFLPKLAENVEIVNPNREISFKIGENSYSLTLTKHRKQAKCTKTAPKGMGGGKFLRKIPIDRRGRACTDHTRVFSVKIHIAQFLSRKFVQNALLTFPRNDGIIST